MRTVPFVFAATLLLSCSKNETPPEPLRNDKGGSAAAGTGMPTAAASAGSAGSSGSPAETETQVAVKNPALLDPSLAKDQAPNVYKVKFTTSKGDFVIEVHRDWAPNGADRFYNLAKIGYYDETRFIRVMKGFMVQWGIHGLGKVNNKWRNTKIQDDPVKESNKRGYVSFAMAGPNSRTTQVFINYVDNKNLDGMNFAPFGRVVQGMEVVDALNGEYGEGAPSGQGPDQARVQVHGNSYLEREFPKLDFIKEATILGSAPGAKGSSPAPASK